MLVGMPFFKFFAKTWRAVSGVNHFNLDILTILNFSRFDFDSHSRFGEQLLKSGPRFKCVIAQAGIPISQFSLCKGGYILSRLFGPVCPPLFLRKFFQKCSNQPLQGTITLHFVGNPPYQPTQNPPCSTLPL